MWINYRTRRRQNTQNMKSSGRRGLRGRRQRRRRGGKRLRLERSRYSSYLSGGQNIEDGKWEGLGAGASICTDTLRCKKFRR